MIFGAKIQSKKGCSLRLQNYKMRLLFGWFSPTVHSITLATRMRRKNFFSSFDFFYRILSRLLSVSYTLLVQFSLQKAHDSIRKAIAGISGISPLRISHLHVSHTILKVSKFEHFDKTLQSEFLAPKSSVKLGSINSTLFENPQKCLNWILSILAFFNIFLLH